MRDFQAAIVLDSRHPLAYYNSGNILLFHRQHLQALQNYDMIIEKCKHYDDAVYQNRGIAKTFLGKHVDALKDFDKALQHNQYCAHIHLNRGLLLYKLGQYNVAEVDFTKGGLIFWSETFLVFFSNKFIFLEILRIWSNGIGTGKSAAVQDAWRLSLETEAERRSSEWFWNFRIMLKRYDRLRFWQKQFKSLIFCVCSGCWMFRYAKMNFYLLNFVLFFVIKQV